MANWDFVVVFDDGHAAWLRRHNYPHPAVRPGNQMPTTADMKWALQSFENLEFDYPPGERELWVKVEERTALVVQGFDWDENNTIPGDYFTVRGATDMILSVLIRLCERCGQLYLYPDSGDPAIVLEASLDPDEVRALYEEAGEAEDPWAHFFEHMYNGGNEGR
jgi:hypothetical protein